MTELYCQQFPSVEKMNKACAQNKAFDSSNSELFDHPPAQISHFLLVEILRIRPISKLVSFATLKKKNLSFGNFPTGLNAKCFES